MAAIRSDLTRTMLDILCRADVAREQAQSD